MRVFVSPGIGQTVFAPVAGSGLPVFDDFNRADDPTGLGAKWTTSKGASGPFTLVSNQAKVLAANSRTGNYYSDVAAPANQYSKALVVALPDNSLGVSVRSITSGGTRNAYHFGHNRNAFGGANTDSRIWKEVANVETSLGTGATALAAGQTWELSIVGTNLTAKINGTVEIGPISDPDLASGQWGLWAETSAVDIVVFDNWEGGAS